MEKLIRLKREAQERIKVLREQIDEVAEYHKHGKLDSELASRIIESSLNEIHDKERFIKQIERLMKEEGESMKMTNYILGEARKRKIEDLGWDAIFMEILDEKEAWEEIFGEIPEESKKELEEWWDETEYPDLKRFIVLEYLEREITE